MGVLESIRNLILGETKVVIWFIFSIFYNITVRPFRHGAIRTGMKRYLVLRRLSVLPFRHKWYEIYGGGRFANYCNVLGNLIYKRGRFGHTR